MPTPEYDMLKMAEDILATEAEVKKIYANPKGLAGDIAVDQYMDQEDLKMDAWAKAVALAEAVKAYMD